jgi:hypothetical protein
MRIPDGTEFTNPNDNNRFSSVFVFHKQSKTIHDDDTLMYFDPNHISCCLKFIGIKSKRLKFHNMLTKVI